MQSDLGVLMSGLKEQLGCSDVCGSWFEGMTTSGLPSDVGVMCTKDGLKEQLLVCNLTLMF